MTRLDYPVVAGRAGRNYAAYVPGLPVCVAVGDTLPELRRETASAIARHLDSLREYGDPAPSPPAWSDAGGAGLSCEVSPQGGVDKDGCEIMLLLDEFPMDWDSPFTWVDGELLAELGVAAERRRRLPLSSGGTAVREVGYIRIRAGGKETVDEVVFAKKKDASAVGARALLGLQVARSAPGKLRRLRSVRAGRLAAAA